MPRPLRWNSHPSFAQGMVQDIPRHLLPDDAVWDAVNAVITRQGSIIRRGGITRVGYPAASGNCGSVHVFKSTSRDTSRGVFMFGSMTDGSVTGPLMWINPDVPTSFFVDNTIPAINTLNELVRFGNFMFVCDDDGNNLVASGNAAGPPYTNPTGTGTVTAGNPVITGYGATNSAGYPGAKIYATSGSSNYYHGRVVNYTGTTLTVEPVPSVSFTATSTAVSGISTWGAWGNSSSADIAGFARIGAFQNRILGARPASSGSGAGKSQYANRLCWSPLPTESVVVGSGTYDGISKFAAGFNAYPLNYVDIPHMAKIEKLIPVGDGSLLILGTDCISVLSGTLQTITASTGGISWSVNTISTSIGCMSFRSVQTAPSGVIFAANEGVHLYDGSRLTNLMEGRISKWWRDNVRSAGATIYASLMIGTHYVIVTSLATLMLDTLTGAWTRLDFGGYFLGGASVDPVKPYDIYGSWYNGTGLMGNVIKLQTILDPASGTGKDDTQSFTTTIKTKTYPEGDPANLNRFRHTQVVGTLKTAGTLAITATAGLEGEESSTSLGSLSPSASGPQTARYDHQIISKAIGYTVATTGNPTEAELIEIRTATNQLRPGRVT